MSFIKVYNKLLGPGFSVLSPGQSSLYTNQRRHVVAYAKYDFAVDGGAVSTITPASGDTIPINALITEVIINITTAFVGSTGNISFGLSAGGAGVAAILANTARGSLSLNSVFQGIPIQSAAGANTSLIKLTAAGKMTVTILTNALTAGVAEMFAFYVQPTQ